MKRILILTLVTAIMTGCSTQKSNTIEPYLALFDQHPGTVVDERILNFANLYNHLDSNDVAKNTEKTYAELLYFNDTLVTIKTRRDLINYLVHTQEQLKGINFTVLNVMKSEKDFFVQWKMETIFEVMGQRNEVQTVGITHMKFDEQGKIILQQDYWDSTSGFFQHIPMLGGILKWIKQNLSS